MRTPKTLLTFAFVLSALAPSLADAANHPTISALPDVRVPEMLHPKDSPESLPETETIQGLRVLRAQQRTFGTVEATDGRCITLGSIAPGASPSGAQSAMIRASSSALPLRSERLVGVDSGKPELEITDGWVDVTSSGIREVRKTSVSLAVLGHGPSGYTVYGFRSEGKVHVVFPAPQRFVFVDAYGKLGFVGCKHTRLVLDPESSNGSIVRVSGMIEAHRAQPKGLITKSREVAQPMTLRGMDASVSVSKTKRDREPLLSVTAAWNEDEPPIPLQNNPTQIGEALAVPVPAEAVEDVGSMEDD